MSCARKYLSELTEALTSAGIQQFPYHVMDLDFGRANRESPWTELAVKVPRFDLSLSGARALILIDR